MTNVLPLDAQKDLWRIHRSRFIAAGALVCLSLAIAAAAGLVPSFAALESQAPSPATVASAKTAAEDLKLLKKAQLEMSAAAPFLEKNSHPVEVLQKVIALRPKGVSIDGLKFSAGMPGQIVVEGAASREQLSAFKTALLSDTTFATVSVPVGALVGNDGSRYSITLTGSF
jgi:hypothetical protein